LSKTALVVDDSRTARIVLQRILETHDLDVATAESAEAAIAYLSEVRPDIIFMDHQMPGMDGFEAVSAIKNNPATATIPIMMYTAQKGELYVGQARALGAIGVLPKQLEPVEVSKVLESLRIIDKDAEWREQHELADTDERTGDYPSLEYVDQDLRVMIQELFDQQRAILRRELQDSRDKIASRVADEIRSPAIPGTDVAPSKPERVLPGPSQIVIAVLIVIATAFAWLYWHREQSWTDLQQTNVELQRALNERQAVATQDDFEVRHQLDEYQDSLDVATSVALDGLEWAANQSSQYGFDELPMGDFRLSVIQELVSHLSALDFRGLVRIESHVGNFCMTIAGPSGYALAATDLLASRCEQIGFEPGEAYELGMRQSVAFANFVNLTGERTAGAIRFEIISLGNSNPLLDYPATAAGVTAAAWNDIAASNNRVDISLYPYLP
jgi:CheY-like chemotaxis protein